MATYTLHEVYQRLEGLLDKVSDQAKEIMQAEIRNRTKEASGKLEGSITVERISDNARSIGTNLDYAKYVNDGRGPVYPKGKAAGGADVLKWESPRFSGHEVFRHSAGPADGIHFVERTKEALEGLQISL